MILALLIATTGSFITAPHAPKLPVFDAGPLFNVHQGDDLADANAINHVWSSALIVAAGERIGGRKGLWLTVGVYSTLKLVHESCFHAGGGPEVRTDLASTIGTAIVTAGVYEGLHALGIIRWGDGPAVRF